jgi:hypothetical protein
MGLMADSESIGDYVKVGAFGYFFVLRFINKERVTPFLEDGRFFRRNTGRNQHD